MPNPTGANGDGVARFDGFQQKPGYGSKKKQGDLQRTAPLAGGPYAANALNAPRRAQRHATGQDQPLTDSGQPPAPTAGTSPIPAAVSFWQQVAQLPGASPLVQELANAALS